MGVVRRGGSGTSLISPADVLSLAAKNSTVVLLDVRTPEEFNSETGHLVRALLIPVQELESCVVAWQNGISFTVSQTDSRKNMKSRTAVQRSPRASVWIIGTVGVLVLGYFILGRNESATTGALKPALPPSTEVGRAPGFTLTDLNGHPVSLTDFRGKVVVLDFWATLCPPCKREIPDFIELQSQYGSKGLQVIGIGLDEPEKVKAFALSNGMNYSVLLGTDDIAMKYGGISGIPTTFIIDRSGKIVNRFEGFRSKDVFENEIRRLLL